MGSDLLQGRVAVVTGGSRGVGAATARALARHGAAVAITYHSNADAAESVVADIEAAGARGLAVAVDAADDGQTGAMVARVTETLGAPDILVCNAVGDTRSMTAGVAVLDDPERIVGRTVTQLAMTLNACRHVVPGMRRAGRGSIVLIGTAGTRAASVHAGFAEIGVPKAAQDALGRHLAAELAPDGIRVNTVAPGMVPTDANDSAWREAAIASISAAAPTGRVSTVDDVADAVVMFASDLTRQSTGAFLAVDGGMTMV